MMTANHLILTSTLIALMCCESFAKPKESAQSFYERGLAVYKVDPGASLGLFTRAAKMGHADAMIRLGHAYQTGSGVPQVHKMALQWYKQAVEAGNTSPIFEIGSLYEQGENKIPPDYAQAIAWYERGISNSSLKSCEALVGIYASCPDSEYHNGSKAVQYATLLVQKDKTNPAYFDLLAAAYARSIDFPTALKAAAEAITLSRVQEEATVRRERREDYAAGKPYPPVASQTWILDAAEKNSMWAQLELANHYGDELGDAYDPAAARIRYQSVAEDGNAGALLKLGHMCFRGEGGDVDMKKAFWCFSEAAEAGEVLAYAPLARMYLGGRGVGQDFEKAIEWYNKSADAGQRKSNMQLSALRIVERSPEKRNPEKLYAEAQRILADETPNSKGEVPTFGKKTTLLLMHYWLAAEQGHQESMKELAAMYFYGKRYFVRVGELDNTTGGVVNNFILAYDYYQQLSHQGIDCPELEPCKKLYLTQLQDQRMVQRKKEQEALRNAARAKTQKN